MIAVPALLLSFLADAGMATGRFNFAQPFPSGAEGAYLGSTYGFGMQMRLYGAGVVQIVSARARQTTPGLRQPDPVIGWGCDGNEWLGGAVGDDLRGRPHIDVRDLEDVRITAEHEDCWYLLLRFAADSRGHYSASDGEVVYRLGGRTITQAFPLSIELDFTNTGPDPQAAG